jgi:hypothetical protein
MEIGQLFTLWVLCSFSVAALNYCASKCSNPLREKRR